MAIAGNASDAPDITTRTPDAAAPSGVDPRTRILAVVLVAAAITLAHSLLTLGVALGLAVIAAATSGGSLRGKLARLLPLNALVCVLAVFLMLQAWLHEAAGERCPSRIEPGNVESAWIQRPAMPSARESARLAAAIGLKANAIGLAVVVLLGGMDSVALGHALGRLGMPRKLTHVLLFTVRYLELLQREYGRLRAALKVRGFRPRADLRTYRTIGQLVGVLLMRSLDRSDRVVAAMKCRGFRGRFYLLDRFAFSIRDLWFSSVVLGGVVVLAVLERL